MPLNKRNQAITFSTKDKEKIRLSDLEWVFIGIYLAPCTAKVG